MVLLLVLLSRRSLDRGALVSLSLGALSLLLRLGVLALLLALGLLGGEFSLALRLGRLGGGLLLSLGLLLGRRLGLLLSLLPRELGELLSLLRFELGRLLSLLGGELGGFFGFFNRGLFLGEFLLQFALSPLLFLGHPGRLLLRGRLGPESLVGDSLLGARPRPPGLLEEPAGFGGCLVLVRVRQGRLFLGGVLQAVNLGVRLLLQLVGELSEFLRCLRRGPGDGGLGRGLADRPGGFDETLTVCPYEASRGFSLGCVVGVCLVGALGRGGGPGVDRLMV